MPLSAKPHTFHIQSSCRFCVDLSWLHALEKEMATHSSVLASRLPGTGEPGGLLSMGSHRVGHDWSDLAAAADLRHTRVGYLLDYKDHLKTFLQSPRLTVGFLSIHPIPEKDFGAGKHPAQHTSQSESNSNTLPCLYRRRKENSTTILTPNIFRTEWQTLNQYHPSYQYYPQDAKRRGDSHRWDFLITFNTVHRAFSELTTHFLTSFIALIPSLALNSPVFLNAWGSLSSTNTIGHHHSIYLKNRCLLFPY